MAELRAFDSRGDVVEELCLSVEDYYEGRLDLIDQDGYRARRGIVVIEGRIYGPSGNLDQEFRNRYSPTGSYLGGRTVHADGTINEH